VNNSASFSLKDKLSPSLKFIDYPETSPITSDEYDLMEHEAQKSKLNPHSSEFEELLYHLLLDTYVFNARYQERKARDPFVVPDIIEWDTDERAERLAWRDEDGKRDAQRYTLASIAHLRLRQVKALQSHDTIEQDGGYALLDSPQEATDALLAEFEAQDMSTPTMIKMDEVAAILGTAADLIDLFQNGTIDLPTMNNLADTADFALDYVGADFDRNIKPSAARVR
jgi:hypothetical protein